MDTRTRYTVLATLLFALLGTSMTSVSALTIQKATLSGTYTISLTDPSTKVVTVALQGTESKKLKVLTLCKGYLKTKKNSGIQCVWNGKMIYSKKVVAPKASSTGKTPEVVAPILPPAEARVFDGYMDGHIVLTEKNSTKEKAIELCGQMMRVNPQSEIMCHWGDSILDTRSIIDATKANQIELMKSTLIGWTGSYLVKNKEQEIGIFALKSGSGNTESRIESISIDNIGSTRLKNIIDSETSARLIDMESGKTVSATVVVTDTTIVFSKMDETLTGNTTRNYAILLSINAMKTIPEYTTTIALSVDPGNIKITKKSDSSRITLVGGVVAMKSYNIGKKSPTISISNTGENIFRIKITNTDENYPISITGLMMSSQVSLPIGKFYTGIACLRDAGVNQACGTNGSTSIAMPSQSQSISLIGSSISSSIANNSSSDFDLYISSESIFPSGGQIDISLEGITYMSDGSSLTERFSSTPTSRSSYKK